MPYAKTAFVLTVPCPKCQAPCKALVTTYSSHDLSPDTETVHKIGDVCRCGGDWTPMEWQRFDEAALASKDMSGRIPDPYHCYRPLRCAGKGYCQNETTCNE